MKQRSSRRGREVAAWPAAWLAAAVVAIASSAGLAQTLPVRQYGVRDGLANSRITCIHQDSKGYLWLGTWEGISRFDGDRFVNYGTAEGLPIAIVNDIAEDFAGRLWLATHGGGIARFLDDPREGGSWGSDEAGGARHTHFRAFRVDDGREANYVSALFFDASGDLWCVTQAGLYRAREPASGDPSFEIVLRDERRQFSAHVFAGRDGSVWVVEQHGVTVIRRGRSEHLAVPWSAADGNPVDGIADGPGRRLVALDRGLYELDVSGGKDAGSRWKRIPVEIPAGALIRSLHRGRAGALWVGTTAGLIRREGDRQTIFTVARGLGDDWIRAILEDRDGNLWLGTQGGGVSRLSVGGIESYTRADGLASPNVVRIVEDIDGGIWASLDGAGIVEVRGDRCVVVPGSERPPFDRTGVSFAQDRRGDWWLGNPEGLFRFRGPRLQLREGRRLTEADGIPRAGVFSTIYEDPRGLIWVGLTDGNLYRGDPSRHGGPMFERMPPPDAPFTTPLREMWCDRAGTLWAASFVELGRIRGGALRNLGRIPALRDLNPRCFLEDRQGRLWIGTRFQGALVTSDPAAAEPVFERYSTLTGLRSDAVWSIVEGDRGILYLATGRGVERLDPSSGSVRHVTTSEGLAGDLVSHLLRDRRGRLWAATEAGLSRIDLASVSAERNPPPVYLTRVQVAGVDVPMPETGGRHATLEPVPASQANVLIEFVGVDLHAEHALRYQYRLEGADARWSPPGPARSVNYVRLGPGGYRFLVRAVDPDGVVSVQPATLMFRVLRPLWMRWWFLAAVASTTAAAVYTAYRIRIGRVLAMERIRGQIALDLHDDVGSGLAEIAILSEVARREGGPAAADRLGRVADLARSLRESMADIVWTVDPRRDRLSDLVRRIRMAAFNLLESEGLRVEFRAPDERDLDAVPLAPDRRRHLLLIAKESLTNAARHARASRVSVSIHLRDRWLDLEIRDDGRGFDPGAPCEGHGMRSIRRRASELGASIRVDSAPGSGTSVRLEVPL